MVSLRTRMVPLGSSALLGAKIKEALTLVRFRLIGKGFKPGSTALLIHEDLDAAQKFAASKIELKHGKEFARIVADGRLLLKLGYAVFIDGPSVLDGKDLASLKLARKSHATSKRRFSKELKRLQKEMQAVGNDRFTDLARIQDEELRIGKSMGKKAVSHAYHESMADVLSEIKDEYAAFVTLSAYEKDAALLAELEMLQGRRALVYVNQYSQSAHLEKLVREQLKWGKRAINSGTLQFAIRAAGKPATFQPDTIIYYAITPDSIEKMMGENSPQLQEARNIVFLKAAIA